MPSADELAHYDRRVALLKPAYLIVGGDGPKITRALERLQARVGEGSVEHLSAASRPERTPWLPATPWDCSRADRGGSVLVGEVEAWKAQDVKAIGEYLTAPAPDAVLALTGEVKPDSALGKAVAKHGEVLVYDVSTKALPRWVAEAVRGRRRGRAGGASTLIEARR